MPIVHDPATHAALRARLASLAPTAQPRWGRMSVAQMLWHVNAGFELALGTRPSTPAKPPIPGALMRFLVLSLPWPKGAPTAPELRVPDDARQDFAQEHARALALLEQVARRTLDEGWPVHPAFGRMTGRHWSALEAKHLDHHLRQFGA